MSSFRLVRIDSSRTLYHAGFDGEGRPIWTPDKRYAVKHSDLTAVKALGNVRRYPWARPGRFEVLKVGGRPQGAGVDV